MIRLDVSSIVSDKVWLKLELIESVNIPKEFVINKSVGLSVGDELIKFVIASEGKIVSTSLIFSDWVDFVESVTISDGAALGPSVGILEKLLKSVIMSDIGEVGESVGTVVEVWIVLSVISSVIFIVGISVGMSEGYELCKSVILSDIILFCALVGLSNLFVSVILIVSEGIFNL